MDKLRKIEKKVDKRNMEEILEGIKGEKHLIGWDYFRPHKKKEDHKTEMIITPGCLTLVLQPLDGSQKKLKTNKHSALNKWLFKRRKMLYKNIKFFSRFSVLTMSQEIIDSCQNVKSEIFF